MPITYVFGNEKKKLKKVKPTKSKKLSLDRFVYSIGIRHIGQENAKIIAQFFSSVKEFTKLFQLKYRKKILQSLAELDGIGDTQIQSINNFFSKDQNIRIVSNLISHLNVIDFIVKAFSQYYCFQFLIKLAHC